MSGDVATSAPSLLDYAMVLLNQQCWCWGRDILRPDGNWLLQRGFERIEPPLKLKDRGSVYQLTLPDDYLIILRGFGVFIGQAEFGGIFLPRFEFTPRYTKLCAPESPIWRSSDLPSLEPPNVDNRSHCAELLLQLLDWIHSYEADIVTQLGVEYREQTLTEWDDGRRTFMPARDFAAAWRQLSIRIAEDFDAILSPFGPGIGA